MAVAINARILGNVKKRESLKGSKRSFKRSCRSFGGAQFV